MEANLLQRAYEEWLRMQLMQRGAAGRYMMEQSPFTNMRLQFRGGSDEYSKEMAPRFGGEVSGPLAGGQLSASGNYQPMPGRMGPQFGGFLRYSRGF